MKQSNFQFKKPLLRKFVFIANEKFNKDNFSGFEIEHHIKVSKSEDTNSAVVELNIDIAHNDENAPYSIQSIIGSIFRWNDDVENVDILLHQNAPSLLLSYLRPIVANAVANAGFPRFDLPFMNFTEDEE